MIGDFSLTLLRRIITIFSPTINNSMSVHDLYFASLRLTFRIGRTLSALEVLFSRNGRSQNEIWLPQALCVARGASQLESRASAWRKSCSLVGYLLFRAA